MNFIETIFGVQDDDDDEYVDITWEHLYEFYKRGAIEGRIIVLNQMTEDQRK